MEAALRSFLKESVGEYLKGNCLEKNDLSSFPLVLRNLQLDEKKVQSEFDETNDSAVQLTQGKIGTVKITPSWMGTFEVQVTNVELSFSFSPTQALKNQMKPKEAEESYEPSAPVPPPNCPPRFCCAHDTSDKRVKCDPVSRPCKICGIVLQSSYKDFQLCPPCSEKEHKCMICGEHAPNASSVAPAQPAAPPPNTSTYTPGAPQGQGNNGKQSNLPPPPPPSAHSARDPVPNMQQQADDRSMYLNRNSPGPMNHDRNQSPHNPQMQDQVFSTQLPANFRGPPQTQIDQRGAPMSQNQNRGMRPAAQSHQGAVAGEDGSISGFLRFVVGDIWKNCSSSGNGRFDEFDSSRGQFPPVRRGGA
jgi:hypothetical protein